MDLAHCDPALPDLLQLYPRAANILVVGIEGRIIKLKVIAEGVESEEQAKMLCLLRCDEMQGYLYSRPKPFDEITGLLRRE